MNSPMQESREIGKASTVSRLRQSRMQVRIRMLLAVLSFIVYSAAVLLQGQYFRSQWHAEAPNSIAGAISYATYGTKLGAIDTNVLKIISQSPLTQRLAVFGKAARGDVPRGDVTIATDGIGVGYIIFASLAMKFFGSHIISLPLGFLTLLALSTIAFIVRYRDQRLFAVPLQFFALTFMLITIHNTDPRTLDQVPIGGYRYLMVLAILPAIHIFFELLDSEREKSCPFPRELILVAFQACLLGFSIVVRSAIGYVLIPIFIAAFLILWRSRFDIKRRLKLFQVLASAAVASGVIIGAMIISMPAEYAETGRLFGNVWHRIFISTSMRASWPYGNLDEMFPCKSPFVAPLGTVRWDAFGHCAWWAAKVKDEPSQLTAPTNNEKDYYDRKYEKVLRDAFLKVLTAYPREVFETLYYDKSIVLMQTLRSALIIKWSSVFVIIIPLLILQCIIFIGFILAGAYRAEPDAAEILPLILCLFVLSLIPPYIAWGVLEGVTDTIMFMYEIVAACFAVLIHSVLTTRTGSLIGARTVTAGAAAAIFVGLVFGINFYDIGVVAHPLIAPIPLSKSDSSEAKPPPKEGVQIRSATYGSSCGAPPGNVTRDIAASCNGKVGCDYIVHVARLGDPAPGCQKDFAVEYSCGSDTTPMRKELPPEAGLGSLVKLSC